MCALAGSVVLARRASAAQAVTVEHGVDGLSELVSLRNALHHLQTVAAFRRPFRAAGRHPSRPRTAFLGFDWTAQIVPARAQADRAVAALGLGSPVSLARPPGCLHRKRRARPKSNRGSRTITELRRPRADTALTLELDRLEASTRQPRPRGLRWSLCEWRVVWLMSHTTSGRPEYGLVPVRSAPPRR